MNTLSFFFLFLYLFFLDGYVALLAPFVFWFWCKNKVKENKTYIFLTESYFMLQVHLLYYSSTFVV
ncbi:hypothetical protein CN917_27475 [Bacillus thuringiensis]|nr:hypothetical protein COJ09_22895 [Bacillus thuringiensis]PGL16224.1 hypothetical protein CN917_27475 [Bacillus thuringiensis]